ncbi:MAG: sulfatase-like hydrolase/transferase [Lentisphaeria bacterium]|nr:sulfatase-like hydrolase/transferase [Lentisphaeria bacterium]
MPEKPNVIVCACDQMRPFEVGCYGHTVVRTPNIDRFAAKSARFEVAVTSNPICSPARSSLLTGQQVRSCNGILTNVKDRDPPNPKREMLVDTTLPEVFRDAGYRTALVGKWHVDPQPQLVGFDSVAYPNFEHRHYGQTYRDETAEPVVVVDEFIGDWELRQAREFLAGDRDQPFFMYYNIALPHPPIGPRQMPSRYHDMYSRDEVEFRANIPSARDPDNDRFWFNTYTSADYYWRYQRQEAQDPDDLVPDDFDLADLTRLYYAAITCTDDQFGALIDTLAELGLDDNTIVVFLSDHGDNLGSHGLFNKDSLIEESIRIPLIVHDPRDCAPVHDTTHVASIIDVMPTVVDLAGLPTPGSVQGQSLAPIVHGGDDIPGGRAAFIETGPMIGIRTPTHCYGMSFDLESRRPTDNDIWFYDLTGDPLELHNLAGTEAQPELEQELRQALLAWDQSTPWLQVPEHG